MIQILIQADRLKTISHEWYDRYGRDATYQELMKCRTVEEIDLVMGNNCWTTFCCHNCNTIGHKTIVQVGQAWDYESRTVHLCFDCVKELHDKIGHAGEGLDKVSKSELQSSDSRTS